MRVEFNDNKKIRNKALNAVKNTAVKKTKGTATDADVSIGQRVKMQRSLLGWSQEKLADALGITFQQVQKYENGVNRIAASRLFEMAQVMGVAVSSFYADIISGRNILSDTQQEALASDNDPLTSRETLELLRAYHGITNPAVRKQFVALARSLAENLQKGA